MVLVFTGVGIKKTSFLVNWLGTNEKKYPLLISDVFKNHFFANYPPNSDFSFPFIRPIFRFLQEPINVQRI